MSIFLLLGFLCYGFAIIDFAGIFFGYDLTGTPFSPIAAIFLGSMLIKMGGGEEEGEEESPGLDSEGSAKGEYDLATAEDYSEAIRLEPDDAVHWHNRGLVYLTKGEWDQAINDYSEAIRLELVDYFVWHNRGIAYSMNGNYAQAIKDYSEAIKLESDNAESWRYRGEAYKELGDEVKAKADFLKAEELEAKAKSKP